MRRPALSGFKQETSGVFIVCTAQALWDESVTDPWLGLNVLLACFGFEFLPQLAHEHAKVFGLMRGLCSPDTCQERSMRDDLSGVPREVHQ